MSVFSQPFGGLATARIINPVEPEMMKPLQGTDARGGAQRLINPDDTEDRSRQSRGSCLTRPGAEQLAERIRNFWKAKGQDVAVRVERSGNGPHGPWAIRSDLINGSPRRNSAAVQADPDGAQP